MVRLDRGAVESCRRYAGGRLEVDPALILKCEGRYLVSNAIVWEQGGIRMSEDQPVVSANCELATKIVAAYVRRSQIGADQIGALISNLHQALAHLGKPGQ